MSFKANLLTKIAIDRLTGRIAAAIGPVESGRRIDRALLEQLMGYFPWTHRRERDLSLYLERDGVGKGRILVLDNDLTIYNTTVDDVVLRKSPTIKEMVSIKNAIKILNDGDVIESRKAASLDTIRQICIDRLDLDFTVADIDDLARGGIDALENKDADSIAEHLMLFAELLGLEAAPQAFALEHHDIYGTHGQTPGGEATFGPLVMFSRPNDTLVCLETTLRSRDKGRFARLKAAAAGEIETAADGPAVFTLMKSKVLAAGSGTQRP